MKRILSCVISAFLLINVLSGITIFAETTMNITCSNPGNIFSDYETIKFSVEIGEVQEGDNIRYAAQNKDTGEIVWSLSKEAKAKNEVILPIEKNGSYLLRAVVSGSNGAEKAKSETVFSRVMSGTRNNKFRFSCHFDAYKATIAEQMSIIDKANAGGYRDHPTGWPVYVHRKGDLSGLDYIQAIDREVNNYGFASNISIPHQGCEKYTGSTEIPPTEVDNLAVWGEYSAGLLATTGAKKAEIWNEPNGNKNVTPQIYVNMVKASAEAIKDYDKTIEVGAGSLANPNGICPNGENCDNDTYEHWKSYGKCYFIDLVECGLLSLDIDAITIHSYMRDVYEMPKQIKWFRNFLDSKGRQDIEIWITEYGWYTGTADTAISEDTQANLIVREYLQIMAADLAEDMTQYNLSNKYDRTNNIHNLSDIQHNFGVVQAQLDEHSETGVALSAKKSYIALAAMNALMANAVGKDDVHFFGENDVIAACDFAHKDGSDITALFSDMKYGLTLKSDAESLTVYDFYGNAEIIYPMNGEFHLSLDKNVTYIKGNLGEYSVEINAHIISNEQDLADFRNAVNSGMTNSCAVLKNDIVLSEAWVPIGTSENKFSGIFDGNGFEISNLEKKSGNDWGFFAYTNGGEIKNLTLKAGNGTSMSKFGHQSGMLVAYASNNTQITGCACYGNLTGYGQIGGLTYTGECTVKNCYFVGDITGSHNVSAMGMGAKAENCFIYGNIKATGSDGYAFKVSNKAETTNSYYISATAMGDEGGVRGYGDQLTQEMFRNGDAAILLNTRASAEIYGQIMGTDSHPVFLNSANQIYETADKNGYMNNPFGKAVISVKDGYVEILSPDTLSGNVMICQYRNSILESVTLSQVTVYPRLQTKIPYRVAETQNEVRAFFWQDIKTLKPLAESR